jgi:hypothetical protein
MRYIVRHALALSLGLALFSAYPGVARADDESATNIARERFKEGVAHFDQKNYDKARIAFLQAYALKKHPAVLLNLAQSELRSGHEADAAKHFSMYLREAKEASASERESAEAGLFAAKAVVGEIALSAEEGSTVFVDGVEEGPAPLPDPIYLSPGSHQLEARKDGKVAKATITAKAGEANEFALRFTAPAAAGVGPTAEHASPGSSSASPEEDRGAVGGREPFFSWVGHTPLAWVGGGLTVAGIAGGIGFGVGAQQNYDNADSIADQIRDAARDDNTSTTGICSDPRAVLQKGSSVPPARLEQDAAEYRNACQKHEDNISQGDTMKLLSIVSWGVAGAAAVGTVVYYFVDAKEEAPKSARKTAPPVRVGASIAPGQGFLTVQGNF